MTKKNFSGFDAMFKTTNPEPVKTENSPKKSVENKKTQDRSRSIKSKTATYYLKPDLTKKLEIIGFYKRKKSISKHLEDLIKQEIKNFGDNKFKEAIELFLEENKDQQDILKELNIT